ncbi:MAG: type II secretion system F family protein [Planctomycetota bacterium]|jgi:type IV pilus assembly protein PilC|nr:type II secretion system F family protein [Planctomycetota bacterium]
MVFQYIAFENGVRRSGKMEAESQAAAAGKLRQEGKIVLELKPAKGAVGGGAARGGNKFLTRLKGALVSKSAVELCLRQLASLIGAGVPIITALRSISDNAPKNLGTMLRLAMEHVRQGRSLSKSLEMEMPWLGRVTIGLLSVGEANGTLDKMAAYAAGLMERSRKIKGQLAQAFAYPAVVFVAALGIGYYMVNKVFPVVMKFINMNSGGKMQLPLSTRTVIWLNDFLLAYGVFILAAPFAFLTVIALLRRSRRSGAILDRLAIAVPGIGGAFRFQANTMWCLTLGALLRSGVDIISSVELVELTMGNLHYAEQFRKVRESLRLGSGLGKSIDETTLSRLAPIAHTMIAVSENSGGIDESLQHAAAFSEEQLNRRVALLGKLVEPAMFVVIGGMVGLVYFGFFMAMLSATSSTTR